MGIVIGKVVNTQGAPIKNAKVSGWPSGLMRGGIDVYSDSDGRFSIEYSGVGQLDEIYLDGKLVEKNVRSGSDLILIKR